MVHFDYEENLEMGKNIQIGDDTYSDLLGIKRKLCETSKSSISFDDVAKMLISNGKKKTPVLVVFKHGKNRKVSSFDYSEEMQKIKKKKIDLDYLF